MRTYISGYCVHTLDRWSLRDSSYEEIVMDSNTSIYEKYFDTLDSVSSHVRDNIISHVMNEDWVAQYDISKVEPKISRHPKTRQVLNSVKIISINSVYDSDLNEDDFFMIEHTPRKEKIPGISTLKLYLKEYLSDRANFIFREDPFKKITCIEDSDGRGNVVEYSYSTSNVDSSSVVFTEENFNV